MDGFSVMSEMDDTHHVVRLVGDLDMATAPILKAALDGIGEPVIFDCAELEFVDSSGLNIFAAAASNGGATLRNVSDRLRRTLKITSLESLCED
jgi:anti-anti-sigma factor